MIKKDQPVDMKRMFVVNRKFWVITLTILAITIAIPLFRKSTSLAYQNCAQIKVKTGRSYIKEGDPLYQKRLDWNKNGVSCE